MHRGPDDDDILDRIRQPFPQRRLLSHSQINPLGDCRGSNAHDVAMRVLLPSLRALRCVSSYLRVCPLTSVSSLSSYLRVLLPLHIFLGR